MSEYFKLKLLEALNVLESVRRVYAGLHSFLNISLMEARRRKASALRLRFSQSLASLRHRPSQAKVRSTTHRLGRTTKAFALIRALDDLDVDLSHDFLEGGAKQRTLISAIGVELQQERKHAEHRHHDQFATVAILDVGRVHDGVDQQALRIDDNVPLLALDLLASVVPRRIVGPPFSALLTLWESITAAVGLASRPIASRHFM